MDIATIIENHRRHMLGLVSEQDYESEQELAEARSTLAIAHDRATTKTLLDIYRVTQSGNGQQPVGQASPAQPAAAASRKVKAGSKAARQRALKAGATRRANLAAKQNTGSDNANNAAPPALSPATHLAPRPPEGGAA